MSASDNRYLHLIRQDCPLPPGTHVVIYCRDSGGEEQDRSVQQQIDTAREYCQYHNLVVDHVYVDEARVSSNTEKREALQAMLSDLRRRFKVIHDRHQREQRVLERPYGVIFWKSNRLGRDSLEATHIKTDLRMRGITILDLVTSANTGNAAVDALIEAFQQWQDEQALDDISQNVRRGLAQLIAMRDNDPEFLRFNPNWPSTGAYLGVMPGKLPRGFKAELIQIGIYKRKKGRHTGEARMVQRMVPDPELWDRCYRAWEMRHAGASLGEIHAATRLYKNLASYDAFFANPIYIGNLQFGDQVYEGFVPPMIPKAWFDAEQKRRAQRAKKREGRQSARRLPPRRAAREDLLAGLVVCGHVDGEEHPMHIESIPAKKGTRGNYRYFICTTRKNTRGVRCQAKRINTKNLEQAVIDQLLADVLAIEHLRPLAMQLAKAVEAPRDDAGTRVKALQDKCAEVQKKLVQVVDAIEKTGYSPQMQQRYDQLQREEAALRSALEAGRDLRATSADPEQRPEQALEGWIQSLRETLTGEDKVSARRMVQQLVSKIVVKAGMGTLYYAVPEELTGTVPGIGHQVDFVIPTPHATQSDRRHPDKARLRAEILDLRAQGMSYRDIAQVVGLHWTRIQQIVKSRS